MKVKLILMSHGNMALETLASAKMIVGDLIDAAVVSMKAEDGLAGTQAKLSELLTKNGDVPTLIIADLKGGTPCNVAMMAMGSYPQLRVLSGLNLAMVIEAAMSQAEQVDELASHLTAVGQQAVATLELVEVEGEEFEE